MKKRISYLVALRSLRYRYFPVIYMCLLGAASHVSTFYTLVFTNKVAYYYTFDSGIVIPREQVFFDVAYFILYAYFIYHFFKKLIPP